MLSTVKTASFVGIDAIPATVEVHLASSDGLPSFTIIGKPNGLCRETRDRVRAAILNSGLEWPQCRITVNVNAAPSTIRTILPAFDLPIIVGVLAASGQIPIESTEGLGFFGEVGLDGHVHSSRGALLLAASPIPDTTGIVVSMPDAAAIESSRRQSDTQPTVLPATDVASVAAALSKREEWPDTPPPVHAQDSEQMDLSVLLGRGEVRSAVEVAAAGGHHLLLVGSAGPDRTKIAQCVHALLPDLTDEQALDVVAVRSAAGLDSSIPSRPPRRSPHHTASTEAMVGGRTAHIRPGEFSLAHHGVLHMEDITEFPASLLDSLRATVKAGTMRVARATTSTALPAGFQLVATTASRPCGDDPKDCGCSEASKSRFMGRLTGPLTDHFAVRAAVSAPTPDDEPASQSDAETIKSRVARAQQRSAERGTKNAALTDEDLRAIMTVTPGALDALCRMIDDGRMNTRSMVDAKRVALTLCDLDGGEPLLDEARLEQVLALRPDISELLDGSESQAAA